MGIFITRGEPLCCNGFPLCACAGLLPGDEDRMGGLIPAFAPNLSLPIPEEAKERKKEPKYKDSIMAMASNLADQVEEAACGEEPEPKSEIDVWTTDKPKQTFHVKDA